MEISIEQSVLSGIIERVSSATEQKPSIPILSNVLITTNDNGIEVCGTNLEHQIIESAECEVLAHGHITLNAKKLREIARSLPNDKEVKLTLDSETDRVIVKSGRSRFTLAGMPAIDYPQMQLGDELFNLELGPEELTDGLKRTSFATATDDVRYYLNGILFDFMKTGETAPVQLKMIATDGHRMATANLINVATGLTETRQFILPYRSMAILEKLTAKNINTVNCAFYGKGATFSVNNTRLFMKYVDGKYPDYQRVIPTESPYNCSLSRVELLSILNRVRVLSHDKHRGCQLVFDKTLLIKASNIEREEASEEMEFELAPIYTDSDSGIAIGFSIDYLVEALNSMNAQFFDLYFTSANDPIRLTDGIEKAVCVIMPMRL